MSIADKITQLDEIRSSMRTKLVAKGVTDAGTHNFADFPDDVDAIQSGLSSIEYLGQMPSTVYVSSAGSLYKQASGVFSTYVFAIPNSAINASRISLLVLKSRSSNRWRTMLSKSNPLEATIPSADGQFMSGMACNPCGDGDPDLSGAMMSYIQNAPWNYLTITVSNTSATEPKPTIYYEVARN